MPGGFAAPSGTWVKLRAGPFSAHGVWDDNSPIAIRIFSRREVPDATWVARRVREAWEIRAGLLANGTTAFRLIYGEADALPGIVVDFYAGFCIVVVYSESLESLVPWVTSALMELAPVLGVVRRREGAGAGLKVLAGQTPPEALVVREAGYLMSVDLAAGQKTGLFLDHRDNRQFVALHARGKRVLNLFAYTGAFSLAALAGGAQHVTSVDSAAPSLSAARENFLLNGYQPNLFAFETVDAFEYLERARRNKESFELVVSDPPSFAKRREQLRLALKAYRKLSVAGLRVTAPGGIYCAASCTSQVTPELFKQVLCEAGERANRRLQLLHEAGHAIDHPVQLAHPEGRYLKFVALRVLGPC